MLRTIVLGAAAGGGVPQWNCGCPVCDAARQGDPALRRTQASVAVSADGEHWFLVNAAPDLRQQIIDTPQLHPAPGRKRHSPISGVILTNGEVDAVAGLLTLREGWPFGIYAHPRVLGILEANSIFNVLSRDLVPRVPIATDTAFFPLLADGSPSGLAVTAFTVPGKPAWYLEGSAESEEGDTIALEIAAEGAPERMVFVPACAEVTPALKARLEGAALVFFDGTVWRDDEMIAQGLGGKTGSRMGHIAMSGAGGALEALADVGIERRIFLHINNSNPALLPESSERETAERAGWVIPEDGMEFRL